MENNLKEFKNEDIRKVGLELLTVFHSFCAKNQLKYSLAFGTLLGSIRHNGFIPWDDDIDVMMPRDDYEKFIEIFECEGYEVVSCKNDRKYYLPFAKVCKKNTIKKERLNKYVKNCYGFNIDIFPLDYVENIEKYRELKNSESKYIKKREFGMLNYSTGTFIKRIVKIFLVLMYSRKVNKYACLIDSHFNRKCEKNYFCANAIFYRKRDYVFGADLFEKLKLHKFENSEYFIPSDFNSVLETCYGDYMKLPPKSEQITHHDFVAYFDNG